MDTTAIIVIVLFALIAVATLLLIFRQSSSRQRGKVGIKGPLGTELNVEGSSEPPLHHRAVSIEDVEAQRGQIEAKDETGRGAEVKRATAYGDIRASSSAPHPNPEEEERPPKSNH